MWSCVVSCQQCSQGICHFSDSGTVTLVPLLNFIIRIIIKMDVLSDNLPVNLTTCDSEHVAIFRYQLKFKTFMNRNSSMSKCV